MTSFLSPKAVAENRPRSISNGGLGGLTVPKPVQSSAGRPIETGTWPRRKGKQRPPPLKIQHNKEQLLVPAPQMSARVSQETIRSWSPATPTKNAIDATVALMTVVNDNSWQNRVPVSRFKVSGTLPTAYVNLPATPAKDTSLCKTFPIELPGSLLLPSQGFSPPTLTPPQPGKLSRTDTSDSDLSSLPSLTTSSSGASADMALFKNIKLPTQKRRLSTTDAATSSTQSDTRPGTIGRPFTAMTLEELFAAYSECDETTITSVWIPQMQKKLQDVKSLLQDSADIKLESHQTLSNLDKDLKHLAHEGKGISHSYNSALKSAQSLVERDTIDLQERLHLAKKDLKDAQDQTRSDEELLVQQQDAVDRLQHTLDDVVRTLGSFIQSNLTHWADNLRSPDVEAVMRVLKDFSPEAIESRTGRCVRIPETAHIDTMKALRGARARFSAFREVMKGQDALMKDQSTESDHLEAKYAKVLELVSERDHEVASLSNRNTDLQKQIKDHERVIRRSHASLEEKDRALHDKTRVLDGVVRKYNDYVKEKEELTGLVDQSTDYYAGLLNEKLEECDHKQEEINELRSQLGSAREEILARQHDVRNVLAQTQAMLGARSNTGGSPGPNMSKAHRVLGRDKEKEKDKPKRSLFDRKGLSPISATDLCSSESRFSSKEVLSSHPSSISSTDKAVQGRRASDPFREVGARSDSVGAMERHGRQIIVGGNSQIGSFHKQLPTPPPHLPPRSLMSQALNNHQDWSPTPQTSSAGSNSSPSQLTPGTPVRRVLSLIPEASVEDSGSTRAESMTNSDKQAYRYSINALDLMSSPDAQLSQREALRMPNEQSRKTSEESEGGHQSEGSEVMTVAEMYHT